jgi:transcriptional regulator with XRE-family HTH domain
MWTKANYSKDEILKDYDRSMLRSAFVSLFWNVMKAKKISQQQLADEIGVHKSAPSRWFSGERPNWEVNTIADIASVLGLDVEVRAVDRSTGVVYSAYGPIRSATRAATKQTLNIYRYSSCPQSAPASTEKQTTQLVDAA